MRTASWTVVGVPVGSWGGWLIVSAVGVRTFAALFELGPAPANQVTMLGVVDIVLTAGMLAGGTAGISAISELLGTYVTASRKRALENP